MKNMMFNQGFLKIAEKVIEEGIKIIFNNDKDVDNINRLTPDAGYIASVELIKEDQTLSTREKIDMLSELDDQQHDRIEKSACIKREVVFDKLEPFVKIIECGVCVLALGYSTYRFIK